MRKWLLSVGYAWEGIAQAVSTQRNLRIHLVAAAVAAAFALWLEVSRTDWLILFLTIGYVITAELVNTAVEYAVDLASPQRSPLAKAAKDAAAGAVLVAAFISVIVGVIILGIPLIHKVFG
ncbi:diacylglycerol kinase family protein [Paenibacillus turpanensis]|uniref:diacylglycerol kinase family protein n=1 Tax=Paenibacillus turpanensis TaxID=2689078 RepID=UPI00140BD39E|nr:diacylglycerol kinase family protein [Paenibacillus turpanensis]